MTVTLRLNCCLNVKMSGIKKSSKLLINIFVKCIINGDKMLIWLLKKITKKHFIYIIENCDINVDA